MFSDDDDANISLKYSSFPETEKANPQHINFLINGLGIYSTVRKFPTNQNWHTAKSVLKDMCRGTANMNCRFASDYNKNGLVDNTLRSVQYYEDIPRK